MNPASVCIDPDVLQAYLLGRTGGAQAAAVEQHLAECPACQSRLPSIPAEDDFVKGFREQASRRPPSAPHLDDLVERLRSLVLTLPSGQDATTASQAPASPLYPENTEELSLPLGPPQQPDEIGRLGGYRILKVLGRGGMGVVYQAEDVKLKRTVALKAMLPRLAADPAAKQRFIREAQAMAAVHHDHVVTIFQVDEDDGVPFLAMEFLKGMPLDLWLKADCKATVAQMLRIGREIAEGLAAAHARGLIHRDVKPGNIWIDLEHGGKVKILDFGLARAGGEDVHLTRTGVIVGTPAYMAPEQARAGAVDARTDLFSLGCVLYRLCTGVRPFSGETTISLLTALAVDRPKPLRDLNPDVPTGLADLVMQLLEKDPGKRPQSAREVVERMQLLERRLQYSHAFEDKTEALPSPPSVPKATRAGAVRRRIVGTALAAVLLLGAFIIGTAALIRIQTPQGDYVVETDDPDFSFEVHGNSVALQDHKNNKTYTLNVVKQDKDAKEVEMQVGEGGDMSFRTKTFTIKRGEKAAVTTWFEPKAAVKPPPKVEDAWIKQVAALPAEKQVEAVAAELEARNPRFDRKVIPVVQDGVVTRLDFSTDWVTDISPLRALTGLRVLSLSLAVGDGNWTRGRVADLSPLRGMKLKALYLEGTQASDLSPLKGMSLTALNLGGTNVSDLSPLEGMPLEDVNCAWTAVSDLSPLKASPLRNLYLFGAKVADLSPLKGMKLHRLNCGFTHVRDLSPLQGMPLRVFGCDNTPVSDLSPLQGMKLTHLTCNGTRVSSLAPVKGAPLTDLSFRGTEVTDLTPLQGMPLQFLEFDFKAERDAALLRSIPTLETINKKPVAEFWKEVDGKKP